MNKVEHLLSEIRKHKSKSDIIDEEGNVWGHIFSSKNRNQLNRIKLQIKRILPEVKFREISERKITGKTGKIFLYGNYYDFTGKVKKVSKMESFDILFNQKNRTRKGYRKI